MSDESELKRLDEQQYIRQQLHGDGRSKMRRYADLTVGPNASLGRLAKHEMINALSAGMRGAPGLLLRQWLFPKLCGRVGRNVVFGRDIVIRNGARIEIADNVVIDDYCVLDARGAGEEKLIIGEGAIINRNVAIQCKLGAVHIGRDSDIGMNSIVHAQGGVYIGDKVVIGGGCEISGGVFQTDRTEAEGSSAEPENGQQGSSFAERGQQRYTKGPIRIGSRSLLGMGVLCLDGVEVGEGAVIGAGSVVTRDIPDGVIAAGAPARVLRARETAMGTGGRR